MRPVRMTVSMSGGGPGGRDWRDYPAGATLTVEDWEAEDLIRIGLAVPGPEGGDGAIDTEPAPAGAVPAEPEPGAGAVTAPEDTGISPVTQVSPLAQTSLTSAGTVPVPGPAPESEPEPAPEVPEPAAEPEPPHPHDAKQRWIDYAVSRGENEDTAAAMTKADLMSKYGGRL